MRAPAISPRPFANVTLNGRPNTGAALGNIAYDRWNKQLFVSDLETGMIHRIRPSDGADLGFYDHGVQGRANFLDAESKQQRSLPPIPLRSRRRRRRIANCPSGQFQLYAGVLEHRAERPAGVGSRRRARSRPAAKSGSYYSVASSPDLGEASTGTASRTTRSATRSGRSRIGPDGGFDTVERPARIH